MLWPGWLRTPVYNPSDSKSQHIGHLLLVYFSFRLAHCTCFLQSVQRPSWLVSPILFHCLPIILGLTWQLQCVPVTKGGGQQRHHRGQRDGHRLWRGNDRELHDHGSLGELSPGGRLHPEEHFIRREVCDTDKLERGHGWDILPEGPAQTGRGESTAGSERGRLLSNLPGGNNAYIWVRRKCTDDTLTTCALSVTVWRWSWRSCRIYMTTVRGREQSWRRSSNAAGLRWRSCPGGLR